MNTHDFTLARDSHGRLNLTTTDGTVHEGVVPVRAFPISAPEGGLSLVSADGHELRWVERLADLPTGVRELIDAELAAREFTPMISRIVEVSTFSTPSTWTVETDRGRTELVLKSEDDIRRLGNGRLLISTAQGMQFGVARASDLDRHSRKLLERFL